jgi:hypothetical protein
MGTLKIALEIRDSEMQIFRGGLAPLNKLTANF